MAADGLRDASDRLDRVLRRLDAHDDPAVRALLHEAVELLMALHGAALQQVLALASDPALGGGALLTRIADDPLIGPLLATHGLHPYGVEVRVARALDRLRPQVAAQGCRAELTAVDGGVARVRLAGGARLADGAGLRHALETALLEAAPELSAVDIEAGDAGVPAALIQILRGPDEALARARGAP